MQNVFGFIECVGIEIIFEFECIVKLCDFFWLWFVVNVFVFGMLYGFFVFGFGILFWQVMIVLVIGIVVLFLLCGFIVIVGKCGLVLIMVFLCVVFGVQGQKVFGIVLWFILIGWEMFFVIMVVFVMVIVIIQFGGDGDSIVLKIVVIVIVVVLIVMVFVFGYYMIMKLQLVLIWIMGVVMVFYIILVVLSIDFVVVMVCFDGGIGQVIGVFVMVMIGFGFGWINIVVDWLCYQKCMVFDGVIVVWNMIGGLVVFVIFVVFGLLLGGFDEDFMNVIVVDFIGVFVLILFVWVFVLFLLIVVFVFVLGVVLGIYFFGLILFSFGICILCFFVVVIDGVILMIGMIFVVFFVMDFFGLFQSFLIMFGVLFVLWVGILIVDIFCCCKDYDEEVLFDSCGCYGVWDWILIGILVVVSVIGWGLVLNGFVDVVLWNNWQGYLLFFVGGIDGDWVYVNFGVFVVFVLLFFVMYFVRVGKICCQENV